MNLQAISFWLEMAWWAGCAVLLLTGFGAWLWARRPWRSPASYQDALNAHVSALSRRFEDEQLAEMEAEGHPIWRPGDDRVADFSERQSRRCAPRP